MRPSDVSSALTALVPTRRPVFLWGPPGVGKSSLVRQAATTLGLEVCDVRAVLLAPVDLRGIPAINGDHRAHWCQPDFLPRDGQGVLFLDELAQAPPLVQSACLQLTLDRRIGEYVLPDGWTLPSPKTPRGLPKDLSTAPDASPRISIHVPRSGALLRGHPSAAKCIRYEPRDMWNERSVFQLGP